MAEQKVSSKTKGFFKFIKLDLADKVKGEIAGGLDPNIDFDEHGYGSKTALMAAIAGEHWTSARALLDAGADPKKAGTRGDTVLHDVRDIQWAKELVELGAEVNAKRSHARTPLHDAAEGGHTDVARLLVEHGADVHALDGAGKTPYALSHSYEIRALLKKHGAKGFGKGGRILTPKKSLAKAADVDASRGAIGVDDRGRLWVGGYSGIFLIDGDAITRFVFEESFATDAIARGPKGVVYVATNWGLIEIIGETFTLYTSDNSELFDHHITYMTTGPDGRAYMLSYESESEEKHVSVFDGERFTVLSAGTDFPRGLELSCMAFDANGDLVLGARGAFAYKQNGEWVVKKAFGEDKTFPPSIYEIAIDGDRWWVGTQQGAYEKQGDDAWKLHKFSSLAKHVCIDGDVVWVGVSYGGVVRVDASGAQTAFKEDNSALPQDDVEGIVRAPDARIWIHTDREPCFIQNGVVERLTGTKPEPKEVQEEKARVKEKRRKLVPFPKKPIYATKKIPKAVMTLLGKPKLAGITVAELLTVIRPAIAFDIEKAAKIPVGKSKFGGKPDMPAKMKWPNFQGDRDRMMPFLLQVNLAEVTKFDREGLLPKKGMLYFFSDTSPDEIEDFRVLYTDDKKLVRRDFPDDLVDRKDEEDFVAQLPEYKAKFFEVFTLPSLELLRERARLTDADERALSNLKEKLVTLAYKKLPAECSRLLGWPDCLQDEIVTTEKEIVLLQLNGWELSPKNIHEVFEHWCSDGLIHVVMKADALKKKAFAKARGGMAYT
ncbi:MAG: DUF1963 domain-containing protein [Polyangiaceae bacterium]